MSTVGRTETLLQSRAQMAAEGRRIVDAARERGHESADGAYAVHAEDHVDVCLDVFRMDHRVDLRDRLGIEPNTVSASDLLLTKLQMFRVEERDLRDIVTLLKDDELAGEDAPGALNVAYLAGLCARDWGLYYDVTRIRRRWHQDVEEQDGESP